MEKWFGGPKDVGAELEPHPTPAVNQETSRDPKTIDDIKNAVDDVQGLTFERERKLEKHRDTVKELRDLGVNESNPDTAPRTETVKDVLNPIEDELVAISMEINAKREEFDLQPQRKEVIERRLFRLGDLKYRAEKAFYQTPSGNQIKYFDGQIQHHHNQSDLYAKEISDIREKRREFFQNDKTANVFTNTIERIQNLEIQLKDMLAKVNQAGYDDNGLNSV